MKKKKAHKPQKNTQQKKSNGSQQKYPVDWEGIAIFSAVAAIITGLLLLRDMPVIGALAMGLFVAFAGLPYIDPKKWKPRPIVCAVFGGVIGSGFMVSSSATLETVILSGIAGLIVGYFSLTWVPHFSP